MTRTAAYNKNYIAIGVSVRTNNRTARNSGGAVRQENNPQSPKISYRRPFPPSLTEQTDIHGNNTLWCNGQK